MMRIFFLLLIIFSFQSFAAKKEPPSIKKTLNAKKSKSSKALRKKLAFENLIKKAEAYKTGSLMVIQDGKFLVESNWESPLTFYYLQGITGSIVTLALGSLVDEGKLQLESSLVQWIPEWLDHRANIKVINLLNHTTGFSDDEKEPWYKNSDTWAWAKNQTTKAEGGATFNLSDTNFLLLGFVISKVTDGDPENLIKKRIFEPLKIQKWGWDKDKFGHPNTAGGLRVRNYDLLKIGSLIVQDGNWNKQKILSQNWLEQISKPSEKSPNYGLGWWIQEENGRKAIFAHGYQGQYILVVPEKKLVAIRLRSLVPIEQNKAEYDWNDFPKDVLEILK